MDFKKMFDLWKKALTKPAKTFKQQRKKASLGEGAKHMLVAGIIAGIIMAILLWGGISLLSSMTTMTSSQLGTARIIAAITVLIFAPIAAVIGWLIQSGIIHVISLLLGGKEGTFTLQSYLIAIYSAPIMIISYVLSWIPFIGWTIAILLAIYSLYLLTLLLKEVHKFSTGRAVLVWLIPIIIMLIILALFFAALIPLIVASMGSSTLSF